MQQIKLHIYHINVKQSFITIYLPTFAGISLVFTTERLNQDFGN